MADAKQERSLFWDIIKGLGIIMIVFGHTGFPGGGFVYLFHLELFFLVTGYLYNEKKMGTIRFCILQGVLAGAGRGICFMGCFWHCFITIAFRISFSAGYRCCIRQKISGYLHCTVSFFKVRSFLPDRCGSCRSGSLRQHSSPV